MKHKQDWRQAELFLGALDPDSTKFTFQTFADDKSAIKTTTEYPGVKPGDPPQRGPKKKVIRRDPFARVWNGTLAEFEDDFERMNNKGAGIFVTINRTDLRGRTMGNFRGVRAVWAELDNGMPDDEWPLKPSMVVESSPGKHHVYWLLNSEMDEHRFRGIQARIVRDYKGDPKAIDPVHVLRLPGTLHMKTSKPHLVRFVSPMIEETEARDFKGFSAYTAKKLAKAFPPLEPAKRTTSNVTRAPGSTSIEEMQSALEHLADQTTETGELIVDDYGHWWKIGIALCREFGDDGYGLWIDLSKNSPKFDEGNAAYKWATFEGAKDHARPWTVRSIFDLAIKSGWKAPRTNIEKVKVPDDGISALEFGLQRGDWTEARITEMLNRMNADHACLQFSKGEYKYLHVALNVRGQKEYRRINTESMQKLYAGVRFEYQGRRQSAFRAWDVWPHRRVCTGEGMFPGSPVNEPKVTPGYLNLWKGFAVEPIEGDWSLFKQHLLDKVCCGNEKHFAWLMDWLAQLVQEPQTKMGSAVVLKSKEKGTGKSMVGVFLQGILGEHALTVAHEQRIVGNFNAHMHKTIVLVAEEAFWAGDKSKVGVIKSLITERDLAVEFKGKDTDSMPNFTRLLVTSNHERSVPVGIDERRFFVLEVKNDRAKDRSYFDPIFKQMEKDGGLQAMLHELLYREITSDLRNPPETVGLMNERKQSLESVERWLLVLARNGEIPDRESGRQIVLNLNDETEVPRGVVIAAAKAACTHYEGREVDVRLGTLLGRVGVGSVRESKGQRRRAYVFPALDKLREAVKRELRVTL